jgi:nucleoside-diphosphate-sugar epimerase
MAGNINKAIGGSKTFKYKPISSEDLAIAVQTALEKTEQVKGKRFSVNGTETITLNELLHLAEKSVGKAEGSTKLVGSLGLSDFVEEFFTGITHDKNMARMAEFFDLHQVNLEEGYPDFQESNLSDYFGQTKFKEEDLIHPIFTNYKMVSLD